MDVFVWQVEARVAVAKDKAEREAAERQAERERLEAEQRAARFRLIVGIYV